MEIIKYQKVEDLDKDLKYWSNSCGDLHCRGKYDITEKELPPELQKVFNELWTENSGSYCYLAEYKGKYGIVLINEFDKEYAKTNNYTMNDCFSKLYEKAVSYIGNYLFNTVTILLGNSSGFEECHEFIVFLPADTDKKIFDNIADLLYDTVYSI